MRYLTFALGLAVLLVLPATAWADDFSFTTVVNPGDPAFTLLVNINNSSTITGAFGDGVVVPSNGFTLVLPNTFTPENFPGSAQSQVSGINNTGTNVGFYIDGAGVTHGFTFNGTTFSDVSNPLTTTVTELLGVNDSGKAAGYYNDAGGNSHPFTWVSGTFTAINFAGMVSAQATDVNNAGNITGFNSTSPAVSDGFVDIGGVFTKLDFPGSTFTQALGLNNNGQVVGSYIDAGGNTHGFLYTIATGVFQEINDPLGIDFTVISGINDQGQIVGSYLDASGNLDGFVGDPISTPEPGSLMLLGVGLGGLALRKLKKQLA